jgi:mono/diheme cytochrome c family protein
MLDTLLKHLPMVRLSAGVLVALALTACNGLIDGNGTGTLTPEQAAARTAWTNEAYPHLQQQCVGCHSGSEADIAFLAGGDATTIHDTLMGFTVQIVNTDAPGSSRLLTKGAHAGPALTAQESADILDWIQKERDAVGGSGSADLGLETGQFQPLLCQSGNPGDTTCPINHVALDGVGLPGATIDLVAQQLGSTLYVTDLKLNASADGVYLEHPLFVSWPAGAPEIPDSLDRFFNVKMDQMPMTADSIGGGTAAFVGMSPNDPVSIHFKVIGKYMDGTGSNGSGGTAGQTGCRQLASFKQNAAGPLQTSCASCHAGNANANAKSAMDITGVNSADDATVQMACNQVRTRINFQDTNSSSFYIAPNPAQTTNHPFKFNGVQANFDNFKAAIDPWVQAEKTSN